ncbi:hypothetical protein [Metabacillus fastidiosus]|uniref:hypothetical protein n=1 Tax=Metabacillus fastidiosus TaxID=1458 RepID=UPI003D2C07B0
MDEKKLELISPEMAKLMVKQIFNKHNIKKEDFSKISKEEKERLKELAQNFKSEVDALLKNETNQKSEDKVKKEKLKHKDETPKKMSLKDKIRQKRRRK